MTILAQLKNATAQGFHTDSMTTEDLKMQIATHNYSDTDGSTQFVPSTHAIPLWHNWFDLATQADVDAEEEMLKLHKCEVLQRAATFAGDLVLYFSNVLHRGGMNTKQGVPR